MVISFIFIFYEEEIATNIHNYYVYIFVPVHFLKVWFVFKHSNIHIKVNLSVCPIRLECIVLIIVRWDLLASYRPVCTTFGIVPSFCMQNMCLYRWAVRVRKRKEGRKCGCAKKRFMRWSNLSKERRLWANIFVSLDILCVRVCVCVGHASDQFSVDKNWNEWHEMHMNMCWMTEKVVIIDDNLNIYILYIIPLNNTERSDRLNIIHLMPKKSSGA